MNDINSLETGNLQSCFGLGEGFAQSALLYLFKRHLQRNISKSFNRFLFSGARVKISKEEKQNSQSPPH